MAKPHRQWTALLLLLAAVQCHGQEGSLQPTTITTNTVVGGKPNQLVTWQVQRGTTLPLFNVSGGARLTIQYAWLDISTSDITWSVQQWEDNLLLPSLVKLDPTASLALNGLTIKTTCAHIVNITNQACTQLPITRLCWLQIQAQNVLASWWAGAQVTATDVRFTCQNADQMFVPVANTSNQVQDSNVTVLNSSETHLMCGVGHVHNWTELSTATAVLQTYTSRTLIVLDVNITVGPGNTGDVPVYGDVLVVGKLYNTVNVRLNFGFVNQQATWTLTDTARLTFFGITFLTLPLGPYDKLPWSAIGWPMWMVNLDRCQDSQQVYVMNCTLVMPPETMDYMSHWTAEVSSPFPDRVVAASWYTVDNTCEPPIANAYLLNDVKLLSQRLWLTENATGFGIRFIGSVFTDTLPAGAVVNEAPLQLTKLFSDPYKPFPEISWVDTPLQLLQALQSTTADSVVILGNISLSEDVLIAYPHGINVSSARPMAMSGWPARPTYLDFQRHPNVFNLYSQLSIRNLILMNGAQDTKDMTSTWAANLTMLQWSFEYSRVRQLLQLQSVTMIIPPSEFNLLLSATTNGTGGGLSGDPNSTLTLGKNGTITGVGTLGTLWGDTEVQRNGHAHVGVLVEDGMVGYNITLLSQPPDSQLPFPNMNITVQLQVQTPFLPSNQEGTSDAWIIVLSTVIPIMVVLMLASIVTLLLWRRKAQQDMLLPVQKPNGPDWDQTAAGQDAEAGKDGACSTCSTNSADAPADEPGSTASLGHSGSPSSPGGLNTHLSASPVNGGPWPKALGSQNLYQTPWPQAPPWQRPGGRGTAHAVTPPPSTKSLSSRPDTMGEVKLDLSSAATSSSADSLIVQPHPLALSSSAMTAANGFGLSTMQASALASYAQPDTYQRGGIVARRGVMGAVHGRGMHGSPQVTEDCVDSFDMVPEHNEQLLINCFDLSKNLQASIGEADVASQLKSMVSAMQSELGDQEIEVTRVIGQGGGGVVYQGTWRGLTVAVKTLVFTVVPMQPMSRRQHRAMNEAAICKTLQHPNIVATYAYDVHELTSVPMGMGANGSADKSDATGSNSNDTGASHPSHVAHTHSKAGGTEFKLFIIQEFCDGGTLKAAIEEGRLHDLSTGSPRPVMAHILQLATDIAAGMSHVHSRNVVHGDLTPANVLLKPSTFTESGYVAKVADFGLSWKLAQGQAHVSNARQGTSFYIAPEVLHVGIMSKAADIFSFGLILHEMYHGIPFWRTRTQSAATAAMCRPGLEQLTWSASCPPDYHELVCSCVDSDPQARPSFFHVVEQLLGMQRQLWAQGAVIEDVSTGSVSSVPAETSGTSTRPMSHSQGQIVSPHSSHRQPTSGYLHEGDVKAMYQSMRMASGAPWVQLEGAGGESKTSRGNSRGNSKGNSRDTSRSESPARPPPQIEAAAA